MTHETPPHVLIVEDDEAIVRVETRVLKSLGVTMDVALSSESAFEAIARRIPDLILLDSSLPTMSGLDVCRVLRRMPVTERTPILMVTGMNTVDQHRAAMDAGATRFLGKPYTLQQLHDSVLTLLSDGSEQVDQQGAR